MRPSSFRALLLALTMVFQTVVGGMGVARASTVVAEQTISAHCEQMRAADDAAPTDKAGRHRHDCQSCLLCAGPPSVAIDVFVDRHAILRRFALIGFDAAAVAAPGSCTLRAQQARAPPSSACV